MQRIRMAAIAAIALAAIVAAPVGAATRTSVTMDVPTTFDDEPDHFTATGLPDCATGVVEDGGAKVVIGPRLGVFAGFKVFVCDGSDSGLVVRLNARFGPGGSVGSWAIVDAWGSLAGLRGSGTLTGDAIENGIFDHYTGTTVG
jgi:hypothetical protein